MAAEGWEEREICTKGAVDGQNKERDRGGEEIKPFPHPLSPLSTLTPIQTWLVT